MTLGKILPLAAALLGGATLLSQPASARTICRPDGFCFNTSGAPIAPWQQPAYRGGFAHPYPYYRHGWRHDYYDRDYYDRGW